jgi:leucyl aminopeptidase
MAAPTMMLIPLSPFENGTSLGNTFGEFNQAPEREGEVMQVTATAQNPAEAAADLLVVPLAKLATPRPRLPNRAAALDRRLGGALAAVIASGDFTGKAGEAQVVYPRDTRRTRRVLLLGIGEEAKLDAEALRAAAGSAVGHAAARKAARVVFAVPALRKLRPAAALQALAEGAVLAGYRFDTYLRDDSDAPGRVTSFTLCLERGGELRAARAAARTGVILAESQNLARQLSNEPANALPPAALAQAAQRVAKEAGLRVRVLEVAEMKRLKMGGILAVGGGSANPPRLIVLEHGRAPGKPRGGRRRDTVCLVGKGITFDSGGISIKPSAGMEEMKHDMSGAAAVVGALRACALLGVPQHVVGVIGAAENMPSGTAYRPGDIVTTMSGKTIEVLNTDAEGRVVLADALHYARTQFQPASMIDLATLTGACVVALGKWASGLFGNDEKLIERVRRSGETTGERAWPLPLWDGHKKHVRSKIATVKNTGGRDAGSSTAAAFLAAFVGDTPWVHLDIAGTAWATQAGPYQSIGATGVGVRLLLDLLLEARAAR